MVYVYHTHLSQSCTLQESQAINALGEEQASEKAFKCFVRSVHALQSLDLQGHTVPQVSKGVSQAVWAVLREPRCGISLRT